ncbi:hypothetical protein Tco_0000775 [Tanacetum coccineum]
MGHGSSRSSQLRGTIGTTDVQVLIDKGVDKEVQYYVYTLQIIFFKDHLEDKVVFKGVRSVTLVLQEDKRPKRPQREKSKPVWHKASVKLDIEPDRA